MIVIKKLNEVEEIGNYDFSQGCLIVQSIEVIGRDERNSQPRKKKIYILYVKVKFKRKLEYLVLNLFPQDFFHPRRFSLLLVGSPRSSLTLKKN